MDIDLLLVSLVDENEITPWERTQLFWEYITKMAWIEVHVSSTDL